MDRIVYFYWQEKFSRVFRTVAYGNMLGVTMENQTAPIKISS